jgi:LmbE family N-acetylglucosaminyl deacetylase
VSAPVVVLSPHIDDAVLSTWSVLRRPGPVLVVNVCAGDPAAGAAPPPWDRLTGARDGAARMRERRAEDREALGLAGREPIDLPFLDRHYRSGEPLDVDAIAEAIAAAAPEASELWAPGGIGAHSDHVAVRDAALRLARGGPPLWLYADLPYAARRGWPEWVTGRRPPRGLDIDAWMEAFLPEGTTLPGRAHVLSRREARRKLRAIRAYRTQWVPFAAEDSMRRGASTRYEASFAAPASIESSPAAKRSSENRIA